jgi:hemoglobin-like flavoprotein
MGAGGSVGTMGVIGSASICKDVTNVERRVTTSSSGPIRKRSQYFPRVDKYTQSVCEASWMNILTFVGIDAFCDKFFELLSISNNAVAALFVPNKRQKTTPHLLLGLINYLLALSDDHPKTRRKLYKIGRIHVKKGISYEHLTAFNRVLLKAFEEMPSVGDCNECMNMWSGLLDFCAEQMYS